MDIYLTNLETGDCLRFPILPERIDVTIGNQFASYQILGIGEIQVPSGVALDNISWSSMFPGENRQLSPIVQEWIDPLEAFKWIESCKAQVGSPKKLRLLITETAINVDVYINTFAKTYAGGYGDINYSITFVQAKELKVTATSSTVASSGSETAGTLDTATTEEERPAPPDSSTYTVVKGDSLWAIAQKFLGDGSRYPEIYALNQTMIDSASQEGGHEKYTIYPGQTFTLPS